ncbi:MAG: amino acid permease [Sulfurovum sp.]|uniref:APC family permease n=1 Tax=Sulfurovum sp. TaxID=1969726 RepID=UPI002867E7E3|nr:amino acid permease [Sulfurovum sp.]MCO4845467.1 amino acid permease [Sulfurovum sp.]
MNSEYKSKLKRNVTLPMLVFYGLGNIFGAGIYVLIGEVAGIAGVYIPLSFLLACVVVSFTALTYAELSARYPMSAGEALYINAGFNSPILSTLIGLSVALTGLLSSATILDGFHGYLSTFIETPEIITTLIVVILISSIAIWGISQSIIITALLTLIESFGLSMVIYVGFNHISWDIQTFIPPMNFTLIHAIILGAFLAFYAFIGFEDMVNIAEEVKEPSSTMPKAIIITLIIATLFYITIALVSISVVPAGELAGSKAPLAKVYETATHSKATILSTIALFAVINGALIQIIMASRIFYGMSIQGWLPNFLGIVHPKTSTPINATILAGLLVFLLATLFPILTLAQSTSFMIFIIFTLINVSLIRIKIKEPHPQGIRTYHMAIPVIAIILNLTLLGFQIISGF